MNVREFDEIKKILNEVDLVSFDVFDTLIFRKTNTPELIFDLVGARFQIPNFCKLRMDEQNRASRQLADQYGYPHANMDEIYEVLSEHTEIPVDWNEVKEYEIQLEKDALVQNSEMFEVFLYAKSIGKRVVATSDMYLFASTLKEILDNCGYSEIDKIYCSADERKAKFNTELFQTLAEQENISYDRILHIGDSASADVEIPGRFGVKTYQYKKVWEEDKVRNAKGSSVDVGLYKILCDEEKGFWYNLGVEVGGPLYMGLYRWLSDKIHMENEKIFFLARDGYNLYTLFRHRGFENAEYLYTSRRALMLAAVQNFSSEEMLDLPPFTFGQTIREILEYLCISTDDIAHLQEAGFENFDDVIMSVEDMRKFRKLYLLDKGVFMKEIEKERKNALEYFRKIGFHEENSTIFDCGWSGSSQQLIESFKSATGISTKNKFYYFGIKNESKSHRKIGRCFHEEFLGKFYSNYSINGQLNGLEAMYELFFSAPHESVLGYEMGTPVLEPGNGDIYKQEILQGILDYIDLGIEFVEKYNIEYSPEISLGHLQRLIYNPTEKEAVTIGDIQNVDGFVRNSAVDQKLAYITDDDFEKNNHVEIWWMQGFLKRPDIPQELKQKVAEYRGINYLNKEKSMYNLEAPDNLYLYYRWMRKNKSNSAEKESLKYNPLISVVMPVYNTLGEQLTEAIESVLNQTYRRFELILIDDCSTWDSVVSILKGYEKNKHVTIIYRTENGHISRATNDGLAIAKGDFIAFMDCDDIVEPNALYEFAKKLNENPELDFIYSDEDKITEDGLVYHMPFFKPDWSPELFMSMMYTNHLAMYRAEVVHRVGGLRSELNGAQDYDFTLRFMEQTSNGRVGHIPKVLYHWRERKESVATNLDAKDYATEATRAGKEDALVRRGLKGHMEYMPGMHQYRTVYDVQGNPKVSIIIPSKDHPEVLRRCIRSIRKFTQFTNYEIIVVDNGSNADNKMTYEEISKAHECIYVYAPCEFNFSKMCNMGAKRAKGSFMLFLNDDIEIIQEDWLNRMLGQAQLRHVGAVGAKLYYPESTIIQHCGISNIVEGPSHDFLKQQDTVPYYFGFNAVDRDVIAVTGACLLLSKSKFKKINGFDETFPVAYNDVDLCFKLHEAGLYNVIRNDVVAYHYESLSRGVDDYDEEKKQRLQRDKERLYESHPNLRKKDPFLNPNIHTYNTILDIPEKLDEVKLVSQLEGQTGGYGFIELIEETDCITISGWSFVEQCNNNTKVDRNLIISTKSGQNYIVPLTSLYREDVCKEYGNRKDIIMAGFVCKFARANLQFDFSKCQYSVQSIDSDGNKFIFALPQWEGQRKAKVDLTVTERMLQTFGEGRYVYLYGAGVYGKRALSELRNAGVDVKAIVVSDPNGLGGKMNGVKVISVNELTHLTDKSKVAIVVALKPRFREEVRPILKQNGFDQLLMYPFDI